MSEQLAFDGKADGDEAPDLEARFRSVMEDAADRLWGCGAVEETLAALYDVLDDAAGGLDWRVAPQHTLRRPPAASSR
ncbi:MAG: hypothetical protein AUI14_26770 [Actinobacteria bacterium 13_2_20CM_2_71_6]|nr:MAG: hypothetical protein AUI14_26770 [Actinobacteria bacterium 13_2_20CM_2_71_6]